MGKQNRRDFIRTSAVAGGIALSSPIWFPEALGFNPGQVVSPGLAKNGWIKVGYAGNQIMGRRVD